MDSTKIFRVLATTFGSQILKKLFNPSMNSFQYGMNVFQVRMNSFHMGMDSYYYRYTHTGYAASANNTTSLFVGSQNW